MSHKFTVGQSVVFTPGIGEVAANKLPVRATVTRLLPRNGTDYQYHIQVVTDGLLRRAQESLTPVDMTASSGIRKLVLSFSHRGHTRRCAARILTRMIK